MTNNGAAKGRLTGELPAEATRLRVPISIRQLDHEDEAVAHAILTDIVNEQVAGNYSTCTGYKGKNPRRWLSGLAPPSSSPRFFGLFTQGGEMVGWFELLFLKKRSTCAGFGLILKTQYRDKGIGKSTFRYVIANAARLLVRPITAILFDTLASNARVVAFARSSGLIEVGTVADPKTKEKVLLFSTEPNPTV